MSLRPAPIGSLLKQERQPDRRTRRVNGKNPSYLSLIRKLPCCSCDQDPAGVAAHLRMASEGKPEAGMGRKPDDRWTVPMCRSCHTDAPDAQHRSSEREWWLRIGIDPKWLCVELVAVSPDVEAMRRVIFEARERRA
jgi:hypothetical protein